MHEKTCLIPIFNRFLQGLCHSGYDGHSRHWCLSKVECLSDKVGAVENEQDKELVLDVVTEFKANVVSNYHRLQRGRYTAFIL